MTWTAKAVNEALRTLVGDDAHVERGYRGAKPKRENFATFSEYHKVESRDWGYICFDTYRPGYKFWGKTPWKAAKAAGFTLI